MDLGEATVAVLGGVGCKAAFDFARDWIKTRGQRDAAKETYAVKTDEQLWAWLARERAERLEAEKKCDERIAAVETEAEVARRKGEECERRSAAQAAELKEVRRHIGLHRSDDTGRHGLPRNRTIKEE